MFDYEEACPVSKAASVLCERWTLQIVREMLTGATRFSEFKQYLPKMSPTLLNARLKTLEEQGIIVRKKIAEKKTHEYRLTPSGLALKPLIIEFGKLGMQFSFGEMDPKELNVSAIVRDFAIALRKDHLPAGNITLQFNIAEEKGIMKKFLIVRESATHVCDENIGMDVDIYLTASLETLGKIWYGELDIIVACKQQLLKVVGMPFLVNNVSKWLGTSQFSALNPSMGQLHRKSD